MRTPRRAEPAHAVGQARRRQAHLRVLEALADLAQHVGRGYAQLLEPDDAVPAGKARVEAAHRPLDDDAGRVHVGQEHRRAGIFGVRHDDRECGAFGAGDEPLASVDHEMIAVTRRGRGEHRRIGPRSRRGLGHAEARADRRRRERTQPPLLLRRRCHRFQQVHVPLVGRRHVQRDRAERRVAGFLERHRAPDVRQRESAVFARDVRREQPGRARLVVQRPLQVFRRPVRHAPRVVLERDDLAGDECAYARLQVAQVGRKLEVDRHVQVSAVEDQMSKKTVSCGPCR